MSRPFSLLAAACAAFLLSACDGVPWNDPYPAADAGKNILYTAFTARPKHLDPAQSYAEDETPFTAQIYMPPLQYHYLKRPYTLVPLAAEDVPRPRYYDAAGRPLPESAPASAIATSVYEVRIRPGIRYQPHPAFARDGAGKPRYFDLTPAELARVDTLADFKETGTRELVAADYVYQIKRLARPDIHSPILGLMSQHIVGLAEYAETLARARREEGYLDLERYPLAGAQVVDRYTYRITVRGKYPQFVYWLAMPFFAPVPWEAERFYGQPGLAAKNITLDWYPVGTGPYMLTENDPNRRMVLSRNPYFEGETYPAEGSPEDRAEGLLADAGKPLPFIDTVVFTLEKESIPYWNKFLQGYYDASGISSDNFDQAVQFAGGEARVTAEMAERGIQLKTSVATSDMYMGFNMLDPVVGGYTERARKLRQALSIAVDFEEFVSIFANGRGIAAQGPIPPGIFGYREGQEGMNPMVYDWVDGQPRRKSVEEARRLLAEAGYPGGRDAATGKPLLIYLDTTATGLGSKARVDWLQKQFQKIDLQLVVRATDWNRFQDKIRKGNAQLFFFGWNADYPDPENFLFLFYGPQSRAKTGGENSANYANPEFDALFRTMRDMPNGPARQAVIDRMVDLLHRDAPWIFGYHPKDFVLAHGWVHNRKPNHMANNSLKYQRIEPARREARRREWNPPVVWPLGLAALLLAAAVAPAWLAWRRREKETAR